MVSGSPLIRKGQHPFVESYSAFCDARWANETGLREIMDGAAVTDVYVAGLAYDVCVGERDKQERPRGNVWLG